MEIDNTNQQSQLNQKGNFLIPLGIIFVILVVGIGAYYLGTKQNQSITQDGQKIITSPTPTIQYTPTTSEWKTYKNEKWGVSIKYPSNLFVKEFETGTSFTFEPYPTGDVPGPLDLIEISIKG